MSGKPLHLGLTRLLNTLCALLGIRRSLEPSPELCVGVCGRVVERKTAVLTFHINEEIQVKEGSQGAVNLLLSLSKSVNPSQKNR